MKLNNKGWGFNEFIMLLGILFVCLVVVVIFYTKLTKGVIKTNNVKNEFIGESNIKNYIDMDILEDTGDKNNIKTGRPAKLYRFKDIEDTINVF